MTMMVLTDNVIKHCSLSGRLLMPSHKCMIYMHLCVANSRDNRDNNENLLLASYHFPWKRWQDQSTEIILFYMQPRAVATIIWACRDWARPLYLKRPSLVPIRPACCGDTAVQSHPKCCSMTAAKLCFAMSSCNGAIDHNFTLILSY